MVALEVDDLVEVRRDPAVEDRPDRGGRKSVRSNALVRDGR
jgi:hypothetical protein